MAQTILAVTILVILAVLCLPIMGIGQSVLGFCRGVIRLGLLAVIGLAAWLWFRPEPVPGEIAQLLGVLPEALRQLLPDPSSRSILVVLAAAAVLVGLPILAILDVVRYRRAKEPVASVEPTAQQAATDRPPRGAAEARGAMVSSPLRRNVRTAADKMVAISSADRQPRRLSDLMK